LKRIHFTLRRVHELLTARITSEPIYELKTGFAHHAYLCAEHVTALRTRVGEMREPPLGLEDVPHPALERLFEEIQAAPTAQDFVHGIYQIVLPALAESLDRYRQDTHPLTDAPTVRLLRFAALELDDMLTWGRQVLAVLTEPSADGDAFSLVLQQLLEAAGRLDGTANTSETLPDRHFSKTPFTYDPIPRRDERFQDLWNQGVNAEAFLYHDEMPARAKVLMMLYKRIREIDVPEMMASIMVQTPGKPWGYYRDMSRQLWDEARHAMMGEVGFVALGVDWTEARITFNWSYRLNTECTPLERHGVLYFIEQGLMPRTGKRYEYEVARESGLPLAATLQDFDWADEVLHSQIGRAWYVPEFGSLQEALAFGDEAWSRILSNWAEVKEKGWTRHENWWPALYQRACSVAQETPDAKALAYAETYEGRRADRQRVAEE
jgi:hypothetical protein